MQFVYVLLSCLLLILSAASHHGFMHQLQNVQIQEPYFIFRCKRKTLDVAPLKYSPLAATHTVSTYTVVITISGVQSVTCSNKIFATAFFSQLLFYG